MAVVEVLRARDLDRHPARRQRLVQWPRVALTTAGVLLAATATTYVVRTGDAAVTTPEFGAATPTRTVVAIPRPRI